MKARYTERAFCHYAVLVCAVWCGCAQAQQQILLQKILFNQVPALTTVNKVEGAVEQLKTAEKEADDKRIELGSLTLYFSERPIIHTLPGEKEITSKVVFFIPQVEIKDAALKKTLAKMNHADANIFKIHLEETNVPVKGMTLTLSFDPARVAYSYDTFDSISLSPGVVFTFYNRKLIQSLATKSADKGLLRVAWCPEKKKTVVIDCGHGGSDKGAAPFKGIEEKNITLSVGLKVADLLKKKGATVILTRSRDITRALDERAQVALKTQPALFVSLHANASLKESAHGIETFCLSPALLRRVRGTLSTDEQSFVDAYFKQRCSLSATSASFVHRDIVCAAAQENKNVCDRGVKQSLSSVLLASRVPAILVEMGFVSNRAEASRLMNRHYQEELARGLCSGILAALDHLAPVAA